MKALIGQHAQESQFRVEGAKNLGRHSRSELVMAAERAWAELCRRANKVQRGLSRRCSSVLLSRMRARTYIIAGRPVWTNRRRRRSGDLIIKDLGTLLLASLAHT